MNLPPLKQRIYNTLLPALIVAQPIIANASQRQKASHNSLQKG